MSVIGYGAGIRSGSAVEIGAVRVVGSFDPGPTPQPAVPSGAAAPIPPSGLAAPTGPAVTSTALDAGAAPVDETRVAAIRKAIETNSYPLIPAKIGDAMIAAGMLLRMPKGALVR